MNESYGRQLEQNKKKHRMNETYGRKLEMPISVLFVQIRPDLCSS